MSKPQTAVRRAALVAALGATATLTGMTATEAQALTTSQRPTAYGRLHDASSMVGTGVTPIALGVSAAGGVSVSLGALALRAGRRRPEVPLRP